MLDVDLPNAKPQTPIVNCIVKSILTMMQNMNTHFMRASSPDVENFALLFPRAASIGSFVSILHIAAACYRLTIFESLTTLDYILMPSKLPSSFLWELMFLTITHDLWKEDKPNRICSCLRRSSSGPPSPAEVGEGGGTLELEASPLVDFLPFKLLRLTSKTSVNFHSILPFLDIASKYPSSRAKHSTGFGKTGLYCTTTGLIPTGSWKPNHQNRLTWTICTRPSRPTCKIERLQVVSCLAASFLSHRLEQEHMFIATQNELCLLVTLKDSKYAHQL